LRNSLIKNKILQKFLKQLLHFEDECAIIITSFVRNYHEFGKNHILGGML